jgi:polygalacturonase
MTEHWSARRNFLRMGTVGAGASLFLSSIAQGQAQRGPVNGVFEVRTFGAQGDEKAIDTPAINRAIETAASAGGGTVFFSAGSYLCYSIHLRNNVSLYLGPGATIIAADSPQSGVGGYDPPEPNPWDKYQDFGHSHWHNSLMWGEDLTNVSILGPGRIWGRGLSRGERDVTLAAGIGNKSISLKNCRNVTLRDISILHGGHFAILATGVDNLTIDNLTIDTNRDAIDVDCCRNVRISNCSVNSPWDDGICLKSSYGLGFSRSTDHVTITNCYVTGGYEEGTLLDSSYKRIGPGDNAPRNGRIKLGTESNGGFRNIAISNCVIDDCRGIALETVDGGLLEDVAISNITARDVTDVAFFLRLGRRMRGPQGIPIGQLRRVSISNVVVSSANSRQAAIISGIPERQIEDVRFTQVYVLHPGGGVEQYGTVDPPEIADAYPDPNRFGVIPAYGFFIRHVKGIVMRDVEVRTVQQDPRGAFVLDNVEAVDLSHIKLPSTVAPALRLKDVKDFSLTLSRPLPDTYLNEVSRKVL